MTTIHWFGHSAFSFVGERSVFIDPFGPPLEQMTTSGNTFDYPPIGGVGAELLLITHEHFDHNHAAAIDGDPLILRSTAGRMDSPVGEVVAVASEHDVLAGTARGPNTIFEFVLDGLRICHFGDFGQSALRPEQRLALGDIDVLLLPVGGGPTIGPAAAAAITRELAPQLVIPMHYGNAHVNWLESADEFLEAMDLRTVRAPARASLQDLLDSCAGARVAVLEVP
jgi:L-ascorbate metabolism protein UlaG (beta-lactamase superfamily)